MLSAVRRHRWLQGTLLLAPAGVSVLLLVVVPGAIAVVTSFWGVENYRVARKWQLGNYEQIFSNEIYYRTLIRTFVLASITGVVAAAMSVPLAWTIVHKVKRYRLALLGLVVMALWMGYLLRVYGWRLFFGAEGVINTALTRVGLIDEPLTFLIFSDFAVVVALIHLALPFAFIPIYLAVERLPRNLLDAASDLGANRTRAAVFVVLPIIGSSIWAGATFAFIVSFGDYFTPIFLGAPNSAFIGNIAVNQFGAAINWPLGAAIGVVMVCVVLGALAVPAAIGRGTRVFVRPRQPVIGRTQPVGEDSRGS